MSYHLVKQLYLQPLFVCMWTLLKDLLDLEADVSAKKVLGGMNSHFSGDACVHRAWDDWKVSADTGGLGTILLGQSHKIYPPVFLLDDKASLGQHMSILMPVTGSLFSLGWPRLFDAETPLLTTPWPDTGYTTLSLPHLVSFSLLAQSYL